jgi:succinate dehydrogenase / fumarate reductase iron-sulfur subunit
MAAKPSDREPSRTQIVPEGRIPVSEFAAEVQGGLSPFGEDVQLPLPTDALTYRHPGEADRPNLPVDAAEG